MIEIPDFSHKFYFLGISHPVSILNDGFRNDSFVQIQDAEIFKCQNHSDGEKKSDKSDQIRMSLLNSLDCPVEIYRY